VVSVPSLPSGSRPRVVVCGLGPATAGLVTAATRAAVNRIPHRFLRTRRHPSADVVGEAASFDQLYESAAAIDDVYQGIVDQLAAAAGQHGEVLYAVPGSPTVAESTVERLRADPRVDVELLPAVSFLDLAWDRLGIDPLQAGIRLVDGHRVATEAAGARGPLLVAQCDTHDVLSEVKLLLGEVADRHAGEVSTPSPGPGISVTVLQRLGLPDEVVVTVPWHELDRSVEPDHLTSLFVPRLAAPVAGEVARFAEVVRRLRRECPWDREQTHQSLRRHLLEETYEALEALDHLDTETGQGFVELEEELGDLLFQVVFHATLAAEEGHFDLADVAFGIREKLIGRHPHVFGDAEAATAADVMARWEQIKKAEKGRSSVMEGIPLALPALLYAMKVQKRAATEGADWRDLLPSGPAGLDLAKVLRPMAELFSQVREDAGRLVDQSDAAGDAAHDVLGRLLLELLDEAHRTGVDPESALRQAAEQIRDRFQQGEQNGRQTPGQHRAG
jgi:tetrapyrrole methylase family protein / MazG family protein